MRGYITHPDSPGGVRLVEDLPEPDPGPDELVLDVRAFAINRGELSLIEQRADGWRPGQDVAGVVATAATCGDGPSAGARVVAVVDWDGWAQRVAVPLHAVAELAQRVPLQAAASLPIAGLTALRALRAAGALLGCRVLITGATGGVGQFAVQLAVAAGAHVTAQVSRPEREPEMREHGAHEVVVELDDDGEPFDAVLDAVGGPVLTAAFRRTAPGGCVVTYGQMTDEPTRLRLGDLLASPRTTLMGLLHSEPEAEKGADLAVLQALVADGRLAPWIGAVEDWEQLPDVLERLRAGELRGKGVLSVAG